MPAWALCTLARARRRAVPVPGHENQMHVVGHQTPGPDRRARRPAGLSEPVATMLVVTLLEERPLATVAALGDMVRQTGSADAGHWEFAKV